MEPTKRSTLPIAALPALVLAALMICQQAACQQDQPPGQAGETQPSGAVRQAAVAGLFYPADQKTLTEMIDGFLAKAEAQPVENLRALICPHAGYQYSGPTAATAYKLLVGRDVRTVIVLAPSHYADFTGGFIPDVAACRTPLGDVKVSPLARELARIAPFTGKAEARVQRPDWWRQSPQSAPASGQDTPDTWEHSGEVQLPFLQRTLKDFQVVPVVFGQVDPAEAARALEGKLDEKTLLVASSDLSHYHPYQAACEMDKKCLDAICAMDLEAARGQEACGKGPILTVMHLAKQKGWKAKLLDYRNSGDTAGDKTSVVGYGAVAFYVSTVAHEKKAEELSPERKARHERFVKYRDEGLAQMNAEKYEGARIAFGNALKEEHDEDVQKLLEQCEERTTRQRVALIDFTEKGDVGIRDAGQTVPEMLLTKFAGERFQLVERSQLAAILKEQDLTIAMVRDNPEKVYGKLKGVKYLVLGSVNKLGNIFISARLVNVATGDVVQTAEVSAEDARGLQNALGELAKMLQMTREEKKLYLDQGEAQNIKEQQLKLEEHRTLLELARKTITEVVTKGRLPEIDPAAMSGGLSEKKACFVTLTKHGSLRGCIGQIMPREPLYQAVMESARSAAVEDPRFMPVQSDELDKIEIEISVLTVPKPLPFSSWQDLLGKLRPNTDGVILQIGSRSATYLPQVWEQIPDKEAFMNSLAQKAGCDRDAWKTGPTTVLTYQVEAFKESEKP